MSSTSDDLLIMVDDDPPCDALLQWGAPHENRGPGARAEETCGVTIDEQLQRACEAIQHVTIAVEASIAHDDGGKGIAAAEMEAMKSLSGIDHRLAAMTTMAIAALRGSAGGECDDED